MGYLTTVKSLNKIHIGDEPFVPSRGGCPLLRGKFINDKKLHQKVFEYNNIFAHFVSIGRWQDNTTCIKISNDAITAFILP